MGDMVLFKESELKVKLELSRRFVTSYVFKSLKYHLFKYYITYFWSVITLTSKLN
jgi:hypothetical protein